MKNQNLKTIITGSIGFLLILITVLGASALNIPSGQNNGAPLYGLLTQVTKAPGFGGLTVVNGAECSTFPDESGTFVPAAGITTACYTEKTHLGTAYQLFDTTNGQFTPLGEKDITKGDSQCFSVTPGKSYYYQTFYCDQTGVQCTPFSSICNLNGQVERSRICGTTEESVWANYVDPSVSTCPTNTPPPTSAPSSSTIQISNVKFPTSVQSGQPVHVTGTVKSQAAGTILVEAGTSPGSLVPLSLSSTSSACDSNDHYAGRFLTIKPGVSYDFDFTFNSWTKLGTYDMYFGVFTNCYTGNSLAIQKAKLSVTGIEINMTPQYKGAPCIANDRASMTCGDGQQIDTSVCVNGIWQPTNNACTVPPQVNSVSCTGDEFGINACGEKYQISACVNGEKQLIYSDSQGCSTCKTYQTSSNGQCSLSFGNILTSSQAFSDYYADNTWTVVLGIGMIILVIFGIVAGVSMKKKKGRRR